MSLKDLNIKAEYRSLQVDIASEFYYPLLSEAVLYRRAVGFFSSSALIEISKGISNLIKNGGKIQLIASPKLSEEDIEAMEKGFELRHKIIEQSIERSLDEPRTEYEERRLNFLANLIANGQLDIKIAFIETKNKIAMYHEKVGLIYDSDKNIVAFTGSMNETHNAFSHNYESIDVFCSWTQDESRVYSKESSFNALWNDYEPHVKIIDFPKVAKERFMKYKTSEAFDFEIDQDELIEKKPSMDTKTTRIKGPIIPKHVHLRPYQVEAIDAWEKQGFTGIFDMATGTGKTYTGLAAAVRLFERCEDKLAIVIVAPYQHLVNQWVEDIECFGMKPIIGHSASTQKDWKKRLANAIRNLNHGIVNHFCFVCTNATFSSDYVQDQLNSIKEDFLIIVDEAHNFGAPNLSSKLPAIARYRLALSATIERYGDEEGTQVLFDYFGGKCIEYTLKMAIQNGMLTPYEYHPILVTLTADELDEYINISKQIFGKVDDKGRRVLTEYEKMLLIKRARLVAGAEEKILMLRERMTDYKDDSHILVYCGATTVNDIDYREGEANLDEKRQVDVVANLLGNELGMKISKFTSEEPASEREDLKKAFAEGKLLQALVAIRCLDEGVNIPSIRTAFILASSTNPKEYIQRRGRVLRNFENKSRAVIYDFITLPIRFEDISGFPPQTIRTTAGLARREIERMKDFAQISLNPWDVDSLINQIEDAYHLYEFEGEKDYV